jgi:hypothetical protein
VSLPFETAHIKRLQPGISGAFGEKNSSGFFFRRRFPCQAFSRAVFSITPCIQYMEAAKLSFFIDIRNFYDII